MSYSRDRNHYAAYRWYYGRGYSYNNVLSVVDEFLGSELINEERASPGQLRRQSRIKPTPLFASLLGPVKRVVYAPLQLIRFKDSHGRLVRFQETAQSRKLSRQVCRLNEALASVSISLTSPDIRWDGGPVTIVDGQVVYPTKVQGYRVFNASWHAGGRFYGPFWQNLTKLRRLQLAIDETPVAEFDFAQLHPRLIYAEFGDCPEGDAYTISGFENQRSNVKVAWQIMLNAPSRRSAILALAQELGGFCKQQQAVLLLEALERRHERISSVFYSGAGLRLQRIDSDLMMKVEGGCISEGIVALPVHDSFIVQEGRSTSRLQEVMERELELVLRRLAFAA